MRESWCAEKVHCGLTHPFCFIQRLNKGHNILMVNIGFEQGDLGALWPWDLHIYPLTAIEQLRIMEQLKKKSWC